MATKRPSISPIRILEFIIVLATLLIANRFTWLCIYDVNQVFSCEYGTAADELLVYLALAAAALWLLHGTDLGQAWVKAWRRNWALVVFLALGLASVSWSVSPIASGYRALLLILSSIVASYLGTRYSETQLIKIIVWFGVVTVLLSFFLVWLIPNAAIMNTVGLVGNWRGAFSHKNYGGAIVAYNASVMVLAFVRERHALPRAGLGLMIAASAAFVYFSRSATGAILFVVLLCLLLACLAWRRYRERMRRAHYVALGILLGTGIATAALRLNSLLALVGRNAQFTGRVPLWEYLIGQGSQHNLWLGYGLWAIWRSPAFRAQAGIAVGWPFQVVDGHSGYMDVFLYLGLVGLAVLAVLLAQLAWRASRVLILEASAASIWPVLTAAYILIVNITISFMFQFETFHWLLLVAVLFQTTRPVAA
jgi:exopolysaccharide production protein ExoQ